MTRRPCILLATAVTLILLAVACVNTDTSFKVGWTYETERIVNISGDANKHVGGEQSSVKMEFKNLDSVAWQTPYCIALVDEERLISHLRGSEIELAS